MRTALAASLLLLIVATPATVARTADAAVPIPPAAAGKLDAALAAALRSAAPDDLLDVVIHIAGHADLRTGPGTRRAQRRATVVARLKAHATSAQAPVLSGLADLRRVGALTRANSFWITNAIAATLKASAIAGVATMARVDSISLDNAQLTPSSMPATTARRPSGAVPLGVMRQTASAATTEPNIMSIGAPSLWSAGLTGQGAVVATLDTGVDTANPDLAASRRSGPGSWFDPYGQHTSAPVDVNGHGTQVMSLLVGGSAGGTNIGAAPGASWIAARVFDDRGRSTSSAVHAAFQWLLDPDNDPATDDAPDVVNNSWTFTNGGCVTEFEPDLVSLRASGILPIFASGNSGPTPASSLSPANYPEAFAVGGVDATNLVDPSSGRGPSTCAGTGIYPTVVAPDTNVSVATRFGLYTTTTGTSAAAPEVAGLLALVLNQNADLTADQQAQVLSTGAVDLGVTGPDYDYGNGLVNGPAALGVVSGLPCGPHTSNVAISPRTTNVSTVTLTAHVVACSGHVVTGAEWFFEVAGADGAGTPVASGTPMWSSSAVDLTATIDPSVFTSYPPGLYQLLVHGRDESGTWGATKWATFTVDRSGPNVSALSATPPTVSPTGTVTISATAIDPVNGAAAASTVSAAEWFEGADPGLGNGHPMAASDGTFSSATEAINGLITASGLALGQHTILVRARDSAGNWGTTSAVPFTVQQISDTIFADGFESGTISAWSGPPSGTARLTVSAAAAMAGTYGLAARLGGASYVEDPSPTAEAAYRARFLFRPNGAQPGTASQTVFTALNASGLSVVSVLFHRTSAGVYQLSLQARSGTTIKSGTWVTINDGVRTVELSWISGASGTATMSIDGTIVSTLSALATSSLRVDTARLGPSSGVSATTTGTEYFDAFASTRGSPVG